MGHNEKHSKRHMVISAEPLPDNRESSITQTRRVLLKKHHLIRVNNWAVALGGIATLSFLVAYWAGLTAFKDYIEFTGWITKIAYFKWFLGLCLLGLLLNRILFGNFPVNRYGEYVLPRDYLYVTYSHEDYWRVPLTLVFILASTGFVFMSMTFPWVLLAVFLTVVAG